MSYSWALADIAGTAVAVWVLGVLMRPFYPRLTTVLQALVVLAGFFLMILGFLYGFHNRE